MYRTTLYLDDDVLEEVRRLADSSRTTQAAIMREAIATYVFGKRRRPQSIGMGRGPRDLAERADDYLKGMGDEK